MNVLYSLQTQRGEGVNPSTIPTTKFKLLHNTSTPNKSDNPQNINLSIHRIINLTIQRIINLTIHKILLTKLHVYQVSISQLNLQILNKTLHIYHKIITYKNKLYHLLIILYQKYQPLPACSKTKDCITMI